MENLTVCVGDMGDIFGDLYGPESPRLNTVRSGIVSINVPGLEVSP